jgi:hypothetical protein
LRRIDFDLAAHTKIESPGDYGSRLEDEFLVGKISPTFLAQTGGYKQAFLTQFVRELQQYTYDTVW